MSRPRHRLPLILALSLALLGACTEPAAPTAAVGREVALVPPAPVDFGPVPVGQVSMPLGVRLTNTDANPVTVSAVSAMAPFAVVDAPALPVTLASGAALTVTISFTPAAPGPATGELRFVSDAPDSPTVVPLSGLGLGPALTVDTTSLPFGFQLLGTTGARAVRVTNSGTSELTIDSFQLDLPFGVTSPSLPLSLPPGELVDVRVEFTPSAPGPASATLTITSNAPPNAVLIDVSGIGIRPGLTPSTPMLDLGLVRVGASSPRVPLILTNTDEVLYELTAVTAPSPFVVTGPPLPVRVLPGATVTLEVAVSPAVPGPVMGTLAFTSNPAEPATVMLRAAGEGAPALIAEPGGLAFGDVAVGTISAPRGLVVRNPGGQPVTITQIAPPAPFTRASMTLPITLGPGASYGFNLMFAPTVTGPAMASLVIMTDAGPVPVELSGAGRADEEPDDDGGCATGHGGGSGMVALALLLALRTRATGSRRPRRTRR